MCVQVPTDMSVTGILTALREGALFPDQAIGWLRAIGRMRACAVALVALALAACASPHTPAPEITGKTAEIVVTRACVPADVPDAPTHWDDDNLPLDPASAAIRYRNIAAAREQARAWILLAGPVIAHCR